MAKPGDIVRFLNSVGGGRITRIQANMAYVEDNDGFEVPVLLKECVVVDTAPVQTPKQPAAHTFAANPSPMVVQPVDEVVEPAEPIEETEGGDVLNIVLGYEPADIKQLNSTNIDTYLVNDSNYYLYFCYMSRSNDDNMWITRYAGVVEPNIQLLLETIHPGDLSGMDHVAVQYVAFKQDKAFTAKRPAMVEVNFDNTKFFKLHCYRENPYFDTEVIAYDIVTNDEPYHQHRPDPKAMEKAMKQKRAVDRRPVVKRQLKKADRRNGDIIEVDLHIEELIDNINGLGPADMLNLQIDEFRRVMDENLKNKGQRIVFIHGKGEGVLRNALLKELNHRYKGHQVQDASFREYGYGATQVTIDIQL